MFHFMLVYGLILQLVLLLLITFIYIIALFSTLERLTALMSHVILNECLYPFIARIFYIHGSGTLTALPGCYMASAM